MTFSSPVATAEFSKFAVLLSAALSQNHLLGFEIGQLEFYYLLTLIIVMPPRASLVAQLVKKSACNTGDLGLIPGLGRSPGEGNGNPLQYPCLENLMDRGAWWAAVQGVSKSWARLSD